MNLVWVIFQLLLGILLLAWSSDRFLNASISIAKRWQWSPLIIGVVLVGFGTSFPELVVSLFASVRGASDVALGNVFGSNIANFLLVFGVSAAFFRLRIASTLSRSDFPWLIGVTGLLYPILYLGSFGITKALILIFLLAIVLYSLMRCSKSRRIKVADFIKEPMVSLKKALFSWLAALIAISLASEWLISSSVALARWAGLSDLMIGLTVVTLGTSLPELAATLVSAWRGEDDIAIGHLIGSNIFNSTAVLAMPALFASGPLPHMVLIRDFPCLVFVTLLMWLLIYYQSKKPYFSRLIGFSLVLMYIFYLFVVWHTSL